MSLKGKSAVVTGSTSGIGLGIARALAAEGADIMLNGFGDAQEIEEIRAGLETEFGIKAAFDGADLTKGDQAKNLVAEAEKAFGKVDILVNNAGIQTVAPVDEFPEDRWELIVSLNLSSNFYTTKAALPGMKKRGWGRIINIASAHGLVASPYKAAYVAAKHGVVGFTKVVALETAEQGITCNAICPGFVKTPLVEGQIGEQAKANHMTEEEVVRNVILASQPTKKFVEVDDLGALAVFLAGDNAGSITGAALQVDGGWVAR
ncbi:3-hydroxybutyrate dehydrogenase [Thalassobaculum sp. OXR-137]|uniref:3-hydroxybutyrate dehydrogenase n=1 Tax=Thalassobaculum sp. OXR-137 TaxID=3100173 RepID=UPI002AC90D49|nr:3-hydroxybutyrate dehydrogenase [Thalassobaculum sp. OXR-137]WPZ36768.1 3-hydroxybutyrate dehydrogenase [Thalassobaculum sp. OXR-137]